MSKPFVFALVCDAIGHNEARTKLGVNSTGLPSNSVMAIELNTERTMNPMVNAGAIATSSLVPGPTADDKWRYVQAGLSRFAGRPLELDDEVDASESATNLRNRGIAHLLDSYRRLYFDPDEAADVSTRQCSLMVCAEDLAVMGATLAHGDVIPLTDERVVAPATCKRVLAVMATAGLYERSGEWMYDVGLPGESGVSGGIVTVSPGKGGLGTFRPRLDAAGNNVRGTLLTRGPLRASRPQHLHVDGGRARTLALRARLDPGRPRRRWGVLRIDGCRRSMHRRRHVHRCC